MDPYIIGEKEDTQTFEGRVTVGGRALVEGVVEGVVGVLRPPRLWGRRNVRVVNV